MSATALKIPFTPTEKGGMEDIDREEIKAYCTALFRLKRKGMMTLDRVTQKRSRGLENERGNQDGFIFGEMNRILRNEIWFTTSKDEAYIRTLEETSYKLEANPKGGTRKILVHVSAMTMDQAAMWIGEVQMWAAQEHGVFIPDPDPKKSKRWKATFTANGYGQ